jgi:hypothetical protein
MRRSMLTASSKVAVSVGHDPDVGADGGATAGQIEFTTAAAAATGTITQVKAKFLAGGAQVAFFTISSGGVVRAITSNMTSVAGTSTYAVSLAIQTGDWIGCWIAGLVGADDVLYYKSAPGGTRKSISTASKPTVGASLGGATFNDFEVGLYGTS